MQSLDDATTSFAASACTSPGMTPTSADAVDALAAPADVRGRCAENGRRTGAQPQDDVVGGVDDVDGAGVVGKRELGDVLAGHACAAEHPQVVGNETVIAGGGSGQKRAVAVGDDGFLRHRETLVEGRLEHSQVICAGVRALP